LQSLRPSLPAIRTHWQSLCQWLPLPLAAIRTQSLWPPLPIANSESQPTPFNLHKAKKRVENFKKREAKNPRELIKPREAVRVLNQETNSIIEEKERAIGPDNLKKLKDLRKSFYLRRTVILSSLDRLIQPEFARFGFGDHFREAIKAVDLVLIEVRSKV
jgi:hypothetical protein